MIGTLESYRKTRDYFGCGKLVPLYVEVEDGERLFRALERRQQNNPKYGNSAAAFWRMRKIFAKRSSGKQG